MERVWDETDYQAMSFDLVVQGFGVGYVQRDRMSVFDAFSELFCASQRTTSYRANQLRSPASSQAAVTYRR